jgi:NitT/TauT family transport system ATP-binding protein
VDLPARDDTARQSERYFEHVTAVRQALRGVPTASAS